MQITATHDEPVGCDATFGVGVEPPMGPPPPPGTVPPWDYTTYPDYDMSGEPEEESMRTGVTLCGFGNPESLIFDAQYVTVCFQSDYSVVERGFSLRFQKTKVPDSGNKVVHDG